MDSSTCPEFLARENAAEAAHDDQSRNTRECDRAIIASDSRPVFVLSNSSLDGNRMLIESYVDVDGDEVIDSGW